MTTTISAPRQGGLAPTRRPGRQHKELLLATLVDPASICTFAEMPARRDAFPAYRIGLDWLQNFVMRPHADLRRTGAVCPFVEPAAAAGLITVAVRPGVPGGAQQAFELIQPMSEAFRELEPRSGIRLGLKALIVFFPDLPEDRWHDFIDAGHRLAKPWLVERGLMLGEFHPASEVPGASNPDFRPMRSPVPAFVLREMALHDTKFINYPGEEPERRIGYLRAYLKYVGPRVTPRMRQEAEELLRQLEAEMAASQQAG